MARVNGTEGNQMAAYDIPNITASLPRDIADLPPDTPVSSLTVDHLDQLRRKVELERVAFYEALLRSQS